MKHLELSFVKKQVFFTMDTDPEKRTVDKIGSDGLPSLFWNNVLCDIYYVFMFHISLSCSDLWITCQRFPYYQSRICRVSCGIHPRDLAKRCWKVICAGAFPHNQSLTHWDRDKIAAISQTTLSNAFCWIKNVWISIEISLKFVLKDPNNNILALGQIMAWRRQGDKPLSEPMMENSATHICVTRSQWVKDLSMKFQFSMSLCVHRTSSCLKFPERPFKDTVIAPSRTACIHSDRVFSSMNLQLE